MYEKKIDIYLVFDFHYGWICVGADGEKNRYQRRFGKVSAKAAGG